MNGITEKILSLSDDGVKNFNRKIMSDTSFEIVGARVPDLKKLAKSIAADENAATAFMKETHTYFEEYMLHGLLLGYLKKDFSEIISLVDEYIALIDDWALCDCTAGNLKIFAENTQAVRREAAQWLSSDKPFVVRFGIVTFLDYFLDPASFDQNILELVTNVKSENYYVNMAAAWFFSVALVKQYGETVKILESRRLSKFVHNQTIKKAKESFRIDNDKKNYLDTLKIK